MRDELAIPEIGLGHRGAPTVLRRWLPVAEGGLLRLGVILALLYFGREVLIPVTLAVMLSLLIAPAVRLLRRVGLGRSASVLLTVLVLGGVVSAVAVVLGGQMVHLAEEFAQYESNVGRKLEALDEVTRERLRALSGANRHEPALPTPSERAIPVAVLAPSRANATAGIPLPGFRDTGAADSFALALSVAKSLWTPIQATGIVLLVLIFVLLEHESLRDRFIRLAGVQDIRATTLALADAGQRLSRYFVSQVTVNLAFGVAIGLAMHALGLPQPILLGAIAALSRFVPYVGVGIAALLAAVLALAVDPGWTLALATFGAFAAIDLVVGQLIEPHLYGHVAGLSPLSVVVAAIFWSAIWGPVGLLLSTPLTLCLVVAGHHVKSLRVLELLLSDAQPLTLPQRFYQRALSGDPHEILSNARTFLRRASFAEYCDRVVVPALHLARLDADTGATSEDQHIRIRRVIVDVIASLSADTGRLPLRRPGVSVLEGVSAGGILRQQRELLTGRWQGPLGVAPGSVVLCLGVGSADDDLAAELLVRVLRGERLDARHFSPTELNEGLPRGADPAGVCMVYVVSAFPGPERDAMSDVVERAQILLPQAHIERVMFPGVTAVPELESPEAVARRGTQSFVQAVGLCASLRAGTPRTQST